MRDDANPRQPNTMAQARAVIARQAAELAALRARVQDLRPAADLLSTLTVAAATSTLAAPAGGARILELIVKMAAQAIHAEAGSLFLIDEARTALLFEVSSGQHAPPTPHFRVPLGQGIAGLVAMSGQPMIISDAQHDPRHASDLARQTDYLPSGILCVPLIYQDEVIGVLELLDKIGAPNFSNADMALLVLFANLAAVAIEQSRISSSLGTLVDAALGAMVELPAEQRARLREQGRTAVASLEHETATFTRAHELARLVHEIAVRGEHESELCVAILRDIAAYAREVSRAGAAAGDSEWGTW